jgi:TRAP-type mannitol/chloroaromatic compound transport system permease large subunit
VVVQLTNPSLTNAMNVNATLSSSTPGVSVIQGIASYGTIAAGGTLGILIPPSVMLVVMGPTIGVPVNILYSSAFGPGLLLAGMYIVYCLVRSAWNPSLGPPVPKAERVTDPIELAKELFIGVLPLSALISFTRNLSPTSTPCPCISMPST